MSNAATSSRVFNEALNSIHRQWNEAAAEWDPDKLAAVYTEDALFFGGSPGICVGRDEIRQYFSVYVGNTKTVSLKLIDQHAMVVGRNTFLLQGFGAFRATLVSGNEFDRLQRTTLLIVKRENLWKIAQQHFSDEPHPANTGVIPASKP